MKHSIQWDTFLRLIKKYRTEAERCLERGLLACSPKTGPGIMRVQQSLEGEGGLSMSRRRKRHTPQQIVRKLRDADAMLAAGRHPAGVAELFTSRLAVARQNCLGSA